VICQKEVELLSVLIDTLLSDVKVFYYPLLFIMVLIFFSMHTVKAASEAH